MSCKLFSKSSRKEKLDLFRLSTENQELLGRWIETYGLKKSLWPAILKLDLIKASRRETTELRQELDGIQKRLSTLELAINEKHDQI